MEEPCPSPSPYSPHLPAEVHLVQQFDPQQDADLVELLGDVQVFLQVPLHQGVQHPPIDQVVLEGLGILGQADVVQPGLGHPVMVQVGGFGQAEKETQPERGGSGASRWTWDQRWAERTKDRAGSRQESQRRMAKGME